jgi:hypothetical protein
VEWCAWIARRETRPGQTPRVRRAGSFGRYVRRPGGRCQSQGSRRRAGQRRSRQESNAVPSRSPTLLSRCTVAFQCRGTRCQAVRPRPPAPEAVPVTRAGDDARSDDAPRAARRRRSSPGCRPLRLGRPSTRRGHRARKGGCDRRVDRPKMCALICYVRTSLRPATGIGMKRYEERWTRSGFVRGASQRCLRRCPPSRGRRVESRP